MTGLFIARNCSQLLWGYAKANFTHSDLFEKVAAHVNTCIDFKSLDQKSKMNLVWAFELALKKQQEKDAER